MDIKDFSLELLGKAISRLEEGINFYSKNEDKKFTQTLRDAMIKRFEFTYEMGHKTLKRFLECSSSNPEEFDQMTFQGLIRSGNERGLLKGDWENWKEYRQMRGKTSHMYDEDEILKIIENIPKFLIEAQYLYNQIKKNIPS